MGSAPVILLLGLVGPAVFAVVDHETGLTAVDADVFTCDEAGLVRGKKQDHICNIHGIAHSSYRLLEGIGALVDRVPGFDPAGGYGVDTDFPGKTHCQGMS